MGTSNASATSLGWDFQKNAAIVIMLEHIKDLKSIRIEGEHEDIEITLNNGKMIYSQAKSIASYDDYTNVLRNLKDSIRTLNNACQNNKLIEKLIYITNTPNPFNDKSTIDFFATKGDVFVTSFNDLPNICKNKIDNIMKDNSYSNIDTSLYYTYILPFHGNGETKFNVVKKIINEFLISIDYRMENYGKKVMERWQCDFSINSSEQDTSILLTKKDIVWPLIVLRIDAEIEDNDFPDLDTGMIEDISLQYKRLIDNKSNKFELVTKVLFDFNNHKHDNQNYKERENNFINIYWKEYINELSDDIDTEVKEYILRIIIKRIVASRRVIENIKKGTNL